MATENKDNYVEPPSDANKSQDADCRQKLFFVGYMPILPFNSNDKTMSNMAKPCHFGLK